MCVKRLLTSGCNMQQSVRHEAAANSPEWQRTSSRMTRSTSGVAWRLKSAMLMTSSVIGLAATLTKAACVTQGTALSVG